MPSQEILCHSVQGETHGIRSSQAVPVRFYVRGFRLKETRPALKFRPIWDVLEHASDAAFRRAFHKEVGLSPQAYKEQQVTADQLD